jgi:hypothetical protein
MAVYATYSDYTGSYLGTAIASGGFGKLALRASAYIDLLTYNRAAAVVTAATDTATILLIKLATCAVADELQNAEIGAGEGIQSERIGNSSVTYTTNSYAQMTRSQRISKAAALYLASTGLMYRGFNKDEYADEHGLHYI